LLSAARHPAGVLVARGFTRLRCADCACERLLPFSCKRRGFCPSCAGRRMAEHAAYFVDEGLPRVPVRQWCLRSITEQATDRRLGSWSPCFGFPSPRRHKTRALHGCRHGAGSVRGWPFSANMQLRTLAGSDELSFLAMWTCLAGLNVI
jgi:Transposase zinc-binding domain